MPDLGFLDPVLNALGLGPSNSTQQIPQQNAATPVAQPTQSPASQQNAAPQPAQASPFAMQPQSGLEKFISNPLVQGAVAAYLGTVTSPRSEGWGTGLARGGLTGLGAFNQAEARRLQPLQAQAALMNTMSQIPRNQSTTALNQAKTTQIQGDPAANAQLADQLQTLASRQETSPQKKEIIGWILPAVKAGKIKPDDVAKLLANGDVDAAKIAASNAETQLHEGEAAQLPLKGSLMKAQIGKEGAESALAGARIGEVAPTIESLRARTAASNAAVEKAPAEIENLNARTKKLGAPPSPAAMNSKAQTELTKFVTIRGTAPWHLPLNDGRRKQWHDDAVSSMTAAGVDPATAEAKVKAAMGETGRAGSPVRGTHNGVSGSFDPSTNTFTPDE